MKNNVNVTDKDGFVFGPGSGSAAAAAPDFVLQWGNRKRQRCTKAQVKAHDIDNGSSGSGPVHRAATRVSGRVARSDTKNSNGDPDSRQVENRGAGRHLNLRQRQASPSHPTLRNCASSAGMRGHSNGVRGGVASPDNKKGGAGGNDNHHTRGSGGGGSGSQETAHDGRKGGSSSGGAGITALWLPKFVLALTNKEKEEDFMAFKGSKPPQRPKKRPKYIQRTLNLISPGGWLCDLTLERYEVRENKVSKKRPRGLKAMCNMDSESD